MRKETMTPRERWLAVLARQKPDRVPMDYWATPEFSAKLIRHLGFSRRGEQALTRMLSRDERVPGYLNEGKLALRRALQCLNVDFVVHVAPRYAGPRLPADTDVFGCTYRDVDYGTGTYSEVVTHPLVRYGSVEEIAANYGWPSPDWYDYRAIPDQIRGWEDYPVQGGGSEPFLIYKNLRGQEQALIDLVENPEIVHYCLDKLFDLAYVNTERVLETIPGKVVYCYVAEDMGGQNNLMFSKKHIRTFLLPRMKRMIDLAHQGGAYAFHHDDGNCRAILPDLIEAGIDLLNPIQWRCQGMDREALKADFGSKLVFHGAVDNQQTLPFGAPEEVRREVADNLRILGEGGGYILAPCHNIQPVTPPANVVAMYEAGYELGWM
jgi:uroporphyrinogen decarboxylase